MRTQLFSRLILASLLCAIASYSSANEFSAAYNTDFKQAQNTPQIYKFTSDNGNITYATSMPEDSIQATEIIIVPPPSIEYVNETKKRHDVLKASAKELGEAREVREELRDEKEKKRLEHLALLNKAKPPQQTIVERNLYVTYPHRPLRPWPHNGYRVNQQHTQHPVSARSSSLMPLPHTGFSSRSAH